MKVQAFTIAYAMGFTNVYGGGPDGGEEKIILFPEADGDKKTIKFKTGGEDLVIDFPG